MPHANDRQCVSILCQCGCNRSLILPLANVLPGDFYACDLNRVGLSSSKFIPLAPGKVRITTVFRGRDFFRIRDILPCEEMIQEHWGSWEAWAEQVALIVLDKAKKLSRGLQLYERVEGGLVFYDVIPDWVKEQQKPVGC